MRLCTTTLDLATPSQPLIVPSYDPSRPHAMRFQLAIPFDLPVPGWLPPSHVSPMTSTAYGVMAHSELGWAETSSPPQRESLISHKSTDNHRRSSFRRNHSNGLFPRQSLDPTSTDKSASKFISFTIHRHHLLPPGLNLANGRTERHFVLRPEVDSASPIECVVTAPSWVDVNGGEKALKVTLRVRGRRNDVLFTPAISLQEQTNDEDDHPPQPLDSELGETLPKAGYSGDEILTYLLELGMEVEEVERFS